MINKIRKSTALFVIFLLVGISFASISVCSKNSSKSDFDDNIIQLMKQGRIPSVSACIIKNDSIVEYGGYGYYNKLLRLKPTKNTVYMAGSVSKAFSAMALMQLYEEGIFDLEDDINDYLPFPLRNPYYPTVPITFKMVLSHQSSLPLTHLKQYPFIVIATLLNFPKMTPNFKEYLVPGGRAYNSEAWMDDNAPGDAFNYSNVGYMLVEYLIEVLSGQDFQEYCKENVFLPLKMYNTSFNYKDFKRFNRAVPYEQVGNIVVRLPFYNLPSAGAGGILTTIEDLSHFLIAHINNGTYDGVQILKKSTIELIHTIQYPNKGYPKDSPIWPNNLSYGLGWMIQNKSGIIYQGHGGDTFGYKARMLYRETDKTGAILLVNKGAGVISSLHDALKLHETLEQIMELLFLKSEEF